MPAMDLLILAAEAADSYPGDDMTVVAWVAAGIAFVVAAVATVMVTPRAEHHDH